MCHSPFVCSYTQELTCCISRKGLVSMNAFRLSGVLLLTTFSLFLAPVGSYATDVEAKVSYLEPADDQSLEELPTGIDTVSVFVASTHEVTITNAPANTLFSYTRYFVKATGGSPVSHSAVTTTSSTGEFYYGVSYPGNRSYYPGWNYVDASTDFDTSFTDDFDYKEHRFKVVVP
jgi:hypothetical protein